MNTDNQKPVKLATTEVKLNKDGTPRKPWTAKNPRKNPRKEEYKYNYFTISFTLTEAHREYVKQNNITEYTKFMREAMDFYILAHPYTLLGGDVKDINEVEYTIERLDSVEVPPGYAASYVSSVKLNYTCPNGNCDVA